MISEVGRDLLFVRNYLVGSIAGGAGSLLGIRELNKIIPGSNIDIQVVTWNMLSMKSQVTIQIFR